MHAPLRTYKIKASAAKRKYGKGYFDNRTQKRESMFFQGSFCISPVAYLFMKTILSGSLALLLLLFYAATATAGGNTPLVLKHEPLPFTPKEFYVAEVLDSRVDKAAVARLIPGGATDLAGGGHVAVQEFILKNLPQNKKLRPIVVRIKELNISEKAGKAGRVEGQAVVSMDFELRLNQDETVPLTQYRGGLRYDRPASQEDVAEPALRKALVQSLTFLNTWMDREASTNPALAKDIKVIFSDYAASETADTVYYSPQRPLAWSDFTGNPAKPSRYAAAVFPSFSYEGRTEVKQGVLHLYLDMKVYMLQSSSWVKPGNKDAYCLNHEQKHFDIAKLVAERFKQKITPAILSVADYNSIIQYHFIESFREMNQLQEQYDTETQHGLNKQAQEQWNKRIAEELGSL